MSYAGFWSRLPAALVDFVVVLPLAFPWWLGSPWHVTILAMIANYLLWSAYVIYFHGRWGQTLGKMALGIRVVLLDGSPITWRAAFLRHVVDLVFGVAAICGLVVALLSPPGGADAFGSLGLIDRGKLFIEATPAWQRWVQTLCEVWIYSELIVLLFNKKKRALHDFIAGTVVIHTK